MRRRRVLTVVILALAGALAVALLPVSSRRYAIVFDEERLRAKMRALEELHAARAVENRPNVVLILADDLGVRDSSLYGLAGAQVATPNIQAIGRAGVVFTDAYCTSSVCAPSRAALLTGRCQQRFGMEVQSNTRYARNLLEYALFRYVLDIGFWRVAELEVPRARDVALQGLPPTEIALPELLRAGGYATALVGKWHLGASPAMVPTARGFDRHYGFYDAFTLYADPRDPGVVSRRLDEFSDRQQWRQGRRAGSAIRLDGTVVEEKGYLTDRIADEAVSWIESRGREPFFLMVSFNAPHVPFQAPRDHYDRFPWIRDETKRVYAAMIDALDEAVGRVVTALDARGLGRDTLLVFASDNGGAFHTGATDNAPFSGGKFTNFEGGLRVPLAMRWEGRITAGSTVTAPVSLVDLFSTVAAAAGIALPGDRAYDGVDLLAGAAADRTLCWRTLYNKAVRREHWKLVVNERDGTRVLYDLSRDPGERDDLAAAHPDTVRELSEALARWERELVPPLWPRVMDAEFTVNGRSWRFAI